MPWAFVLADLATVAAVVSSLAAFLAVVKTRYDAIMVEINRLAPDVYGRCGARGA